MTSIDARIDTIIASDLAIRLKAEGYRKSGRTFFRVGHEHTSIVNVQGNKWNQGIEDLKMAIERLPRAQARFEAWGKRYGLTK